MDIPAWVWKLSKRMSDRRIYWRFVSFHTGINTFLKKVLYNIWFKVVNYNKFFSKELEQIAEMVILFHFHQLLNKF